MGLSASFYHLYSNTFMRMLAYTKPPIDSQEISARAQINARFVPDQSFLSAPAYDQPANRVICIAI